MVRFHKPIRADLTYSLETQTPTHTHTLPMVLICTSMLEQLSHKVSQKRYKKEANTIQCLHATLLTPHSFLSPQEKMGNEETESLQMDRDDILEWAEMYRKMCLREK